MSIVIVEIIGALYFFIGHDSSGVMLCVLCMLGIIAGRLSNRGND